MAKKKLKRLSKKGKAQAKESSSSFTETANQIWLAGLGAFAKAQEEGTKAYERLVNEGQRFSRKTKDSTEATVNEVKGAVEGTVSQVQSKANQSWDKLEKVFEDRVAKALAALGVPSASDIKSLSKRVAELQDAVESYKKEAAKADTKPAKVVTPAASAKSSKPKAAKKKAAKKKATKKTAAKKKATKKAAAKKSSSKKAASKS